MNAIECRNVWKIFGERANDALAAGRDRMITKQSVLDEFDCVLAVADASFSIRNSEILCVMGLSGSGKSTLIRHINRLIEPTAGQILLNGEDIALASETELREIRARKIGMVFQHMALLPHRRVKENVAFPLELRKVPKEQRLRAAREKLAQVQLEDWGDRYPSELSGGMQQRVGLARALAADPDILLMDEPFSALDPLIRRQLQDQFLQLSEEMRKTTLFITHDLDEAIRLGDRIAIMKDARIVQIGTAEEIIRNPVDDYVSDFVAGISALKFVRAQTIMTPVDVASQEFEELSEYPAVHEDANLNTLIDIFKETDVKVVVRDKEEQPVGTISKRILLEEIQGQAKK